MSISRLAEIRRLQHEGTFLRRILAQGDRDPLLQQILNDFRQMRGTCRLRMRTLVSEFCSTWPPRHLRVLPRLTTSQIWKPSVLEPQGVGFIKGAGIDDIWISCLRWSLFQSHARGVASAITGRNYTTDRVAIPAASWNAESMPPPQMLSAAGIPGVQHAEYYRLAKQICDGYDYYVGLRTQIVDVLTALGMQAPEMVRGYGEGVFARGDLDVPPAAPDRRTKRKNPVVSEQAEVDEAFLLAYQDSVQQDAENADAVGQVAHVA